MSIIQIVGPSALEKSLIFLQALPEGGSRAIKPGRLHLRRWMDGEEPIDDLIVVYREGEIPSMTLNTHGSVRVVDRILMCLERVGVRVVRTPPARHVWPGIDSLEATVMDTLPRVQTELVANWLLDQIAGLRAWTSETLHLCEYDPQAAQRRILSLERTHAFGSRMVEGFRVVIVGPPNAGKSTLANQLFDEPWSMESDQPGTTRDWVQQSIAIDGILFVLTDTAGIRETTDPIELQAFTNTHPLICEADIQLLVLDGSRQERLWGHSWQEELIEPRKAILILNKSDLGCVHSPDYIRSQLPVNLGNIVVLSALHRHELSQLRSLLLKVVNADPHHLPSPVIWTVQQRHALSEAVACLKTRSERVKDVLRSEFCKLSEDFST